MSPPSEGAVAEQFTSDLLETSSIEPWQLFGDTDVREPEAHARNSNFSAALEWARKGYNVVPQAAVDKKYPAVKWKGLQDRHAEPDELDGWRHLFENGVGFITGAVSGIIVIESDGPEGEAVLAEFEREHGPLPDTLTIRSGSGRGLHRHFKHPGFTVKTVANPSIKLDVKGDKGYCVLPPSLHKSGRRYEVVHDAEPAELPKGLLEFIEMKAAEADMASPGTRASASASAGLVTTPPHANNDELEENTLPAGRTPQPAEVMRAALQHLVDRNYFGGRGGVVRDDNGCILKVGWIQTGMALKLAYGDDDGFDLWSVTHIDDQARADAPAQWASFASEVRPGDVTIGTIIKAAKDAGFVFPTLRTDAAASGHVSYGSFTMDADGGLTKQVTGRGKNSDIETVRVSSPFEILGQCRDPQGRAWGKQIQFRDADGRVHMHHVSDAALHGEPGALCAELAGAGLYINRSRQKELVEYLSGVAVSARVTNVGRTGWHEVGDRRVFVLPAETISSDIGETVSLDATAHGPYEARGSLEDWKKGVGALTAGHALPMFMVSAALAGPLAYLVGAEGGGVHVFGDSSIGKSATLAAGASVWGRGSAKGGYMRSWRATANGLEGAAASATDTCLVLDELGVGEARDVAASVYALANGSGKQRARRDGSLQEPKSWRVFLLSSGELPVEAKIGEDYGRKARAGQAVRLLDVPADQGHGFGVFDHAGEWGDAGKLADAIKSAACSAYGTAGPEFVRRLLASGGEHLVAWAKGMLDNITRNLVEPGASEQVARAAKKFALIGIAGELATHMGITPWAKGGAFKAASQAFERWLEARGGAGSHDERQAIEQVRSMIVRHGDSRFDRADVPPSNLGGTPIIRDRLGWVKGEGGEREWWVPSEIWRVEFCAGLDPTSVARTLASRGMLRRGDRKNLMCPVTPKGNQKMRCYVLTAAILGDNEG